MISIYYMMAGEMSRGEWSKGAGKWAGRLYGGGAPGIAEAIYGRRCQYAFPVAWMDAHNGSLSEGAGRRRRESFPFEAADEMRGRACALPVVRGSPKWPIPSSISPSPLRRASLRDDARLLARPQKAKSTSVDLAALPTYPGTKTNPARTTIPQCGRGKDDGQSPVPFRTN